MRWFACLLAAIATAGPVAATDAAADGKHATLSSAEDAGVCTEQLLRSIVADDPDAVGRQHLHVGPVRVEHGTPVVRVFWREANAILLIDPRDACPNSGDDAPDLGWYRTKGRIDLDTDVVPTREAIGGSTYLVDRPWVDAVIADCRAHGTLLAVEGGRTP